MATRHVCVVWWPVAGSGFARCAHPHEPLSVPQRHQPTLPTGDEKRREIVFHATERRRGDERAQVDRHGATAAQWAAGGGHVDCLRFLLEDCGVVPTAASACLYTARLSSLFLCLSITPLTSLASSRCFRWPALHGEQTRNRIEPRAVSLERAPSADPPRHGSTHAASQPLRRPQLPQTTAFDSSSAVH